jgi:hypothetical protein
MVTELITEKRQNIRHWIWRQRLERAYSEHAGLIGDGSQLHLVLGVAGSGVDHLARLIVQPGTNLRYFRNPLARFDPRLQLGAGHDRLGMPCCKQLEREHPLLRVYRMLVEYDNPWSTLRTTNRVVTEEPETVPAMVCECHALLATEALLRDLGAHILLYVSDPVCVVDRMLDEQGLETSYLEEEGRSMLSPYFLGRFLRRNYTEVMHTYRHIQRIQDVRERKVFQQVLVVALIQHMFRMLSARYPAQVALVDYQRLAQDPQSLAAALEHLFGELGIEIAHAVASGATFVPSGRATSIWKSTWPERLPSGFLSPQETRGCYQVLRNAGLSTQEPTASLLSQEPARARRA